MPTFLLPQYGSLNRINMVVCIGNENSFYVLKIYFMSLCGPAMRPLIKTKWMMQALKIELNPRSNARMEF